MWMAPRKIAYRFVPKRGEVVRHRGGSVGIAHRSYPINGKGWLSYVEFFWPNPWFEHVLTADLSPLSTLELVAVVAETDLPERGELS